MGFFDNILDETHHLLRASCRRFAEKHIAPFAVAWEEAGEFPRALYQEAAAAGVLGVGFPEELGGCGGGALHMVMAVEGLLRGGSSGVVAGLGSLGIALPPVVQSEDVALIERVVKPTLRGERVAALAITEPGTGSDVAAVATRAVLSADGGHYTVNGAKMFITSGVRADFLSVLVRTGDDPHGGLSFLLIERDRPGVHVSRALRKTGWCASDTAELAFEGVEVPVSNRLGPEGGGFLTLMRNFQTERLALAAYGCATAQLAVEEAQRYVTERRAFGKPLSKHQVTRHKLADMASKTLAATALTYQVAARMDAGEYPVMEVSVAKNVAAEAAVAVTYEAVQLFGGMGYMRETLVERLSRDARLLPIGGGTQEIMREIIARQMGL
jgi:acyl-CoA dehydrogenase